MANLAINSPQENVYEAMRDQKWSAGEKAIARKAFEKALGQELGATLEQFKRKASKVNDTDEMWNMEGWLGARRREIDQKYDYRYSVLPLLLGTLLSEGRITMADLAGLREEKLAQIRRIAEL